jgi:hypothetical protein
MQNLPGMNIGAVEDSQRLFERDGQLFLSFQIENEFGFLSGESGRDIQRPILTSCSFCDGNSHNSAIC